MDFNAVEPGTFGVFRLILVLLDNAGDFISLQGAGHRHRHEAFCCVGLAFGLDRRWRNRRRAIGLQLGAGVAAYVPPLADYLAACGVYRIGDYFPASHLRSEEPTSELQSLMRNSYDVLCLKKKKYR